MASPNEDESSTQLQFTVLYGSHAVNAAHCYLLEVSGVKILLDCGWDSSFDTAMLEPLEKVADKIALVLISHANLEHLGALPYAYKRFKLTAPCYLTSPVIKLGQLALYDAVLNGSAPYTLDEIDAAITSWKELKYKQPGKLELPGQESIFITPHAAGRTLGGAVWSIAQEPGGSEHGLSVLYASDICQRRERFIDGLDLGQNRSVPRKPTLLIQDCLSLSKAIQIPTQKLDVRDAELVRTVLECLRKGGDVLIPVDSCSRVFEILLALDEEWTRGQLQKSYELVFLTRISSIIDMANSHLEWASRKLQDFSDSSGQGYNPLRLSQVAVVDSFEEAFATANTSARIRPPRVIVCAGVDMEKDSFSREVFVREILHRPNCLVLIACESFVQNSIPTQLAAQVGVQYKIVNMVEERWVDLEGEELAEYLQRKKALEEERQRERETETELMNFEQESQRDLVDDDIVTNDFVPANPTDLQRTPSLPLERARSIPGSMEPTNLARTAAYRDMMDREDVLTFTFTSVQENEPMWDEYGAIYDSNELLGEEEAKNAGLLDTNGKRKGAQGGQTLKRSGSEPLDESVARRLQDTNADLEDMGAKKKVSSIVQKPVRCDVRVVDFDGRMNGRDLLEFVDFIRPKKLVVVRSSLRDSEQFAVECQNRHCGVALAPAPGECLDIAADSSVVRVRIADETLQTAPAPLTVGNLVVQRLRGKIALRSMAGANQSDATRGKRRRVVTAGGELPTIVPIKEGETIPGDGVDSYFVSKELGLTAILLKLSAANIHSESATTEDGRQVLLCGSGEVVVWKPGDGQFIIGGPMCDTYFAVRRALYDCFALV